MDITDEHPNGKGSGNGMWKWDYEVQPTKYLDRPASRVVLKTKFRWTPITSTIDMSVVSYELCCLPGDILPCCLSYLTG